MSSLHVNPQDGGFSMLFCFLVQHTSSSVSFLFTIFVFKLYVPCFPHDPSFSWLLSHSLGGVSSVHYVLVSALFF